MKNVILSAVMMASLAGAANAAIVYSWTTETGSRSNPGNAALINFDDVFIDNLLVGANTAITLDRVTVGIRRTATAPATDITVWAAPMLGDLTGPAAVGTPVALGTVSLAARSASAFVTELVSVSSTTTVSLNSLVAGATPNFSGLFIGVSISNTSTDNGWRIVSGGTAGANITDRFFQYDTSTNTAIGPVAFAAPTPSAFYTVVDGTFVPTPGALALLGLGGIVAGRRRR
jgi:MYXO-CTERM domain-containing protein